MAKSSADGFEFYRATNGSTERPTPIRFIVANSTTLKIGDAVRVNTSGLLVAAGVGGNVLGIIDGFVDNNGINVLGYGYTGATGHTDASSNQGDDTVTTASDNSSRALAVHAEVLLDVAGEILWLNDSSGTLSQTNLLQLFDVDAADSRTIDQSSADDTSGQFQLLVLDPDATGGKTADASKGLFRIVETQLISQIGNSTAVVAV